MPAVKSVPTFRTVFVSTAGVLVLAQPGPEGPALLAALSALGTAQRAHFVVDEMPALNAGGFRRWRLLAPPGVPNAVLYLELAGDAGAMYRWLSASQYPVMGGWWVRGAAGLAPVGAVGP